MNNVIILDECLQQFKKENLLKLKSDELFEFFTAIQVTKNNDLTYEDIESGIVDGTLDGGIDFIYLIVDNFLIRTLEDLDDLENQENKKLKIFIGQAKISKGFKESQVDKLNISMPLIYDNDIGTKELNERFNEEIIEKALLIRKAYSRAIMNAWSINIHYIFASKSNEKSLTSSCKSKLRQLETETTKFLRDAKVIVEVLSSNELIDLYKKKKSERFELVFKESPLAVNYQEGLGYVGVVGLGEYVSFIKDNSGAIIEGLFESNVRHYQGKVDVNKRIENTIQKDYEVDFWWLNNGITLITSDVRQLGKKLSLKDVQIVNGLQTSFSLGKVYGQNENDERSILVKIVVNHDPGTIDKIISATNSQSPVSPTLLRATDKTQRRIEDFFLTKGYFYDRRKNYYKNQGKPASKIIGIQTAAQAIHSIKNYEPATARSKPTTLIKNDDTYKKIFDSNDKFEIFLNCCIVSNKVNHFIKDNLNGESKTRGKILKYHLGRIATAFCFSKTFYNAKDLQQLNIDVINDKLFEKASSFLFDIISEVENDYMDINSLSKSKKFEESLNEKLLESLEG
jgi:hypothetical protein